MQRLSNSTVVFVCLVVGGAIVLYHSSRQSTRTSDSLAMSQHSPAAVDLELHGESSQDAAPLRRLPLSPSSPSENALATHTIDGMTEAGEPGFHNSLRSHRSSLSLLPPTNDAANNWPPAEANSSDGDFVSENRQDDVLVNEAPTAAPTAVVTIPVAAPITTAPVIVKVQTSSPFSRESESDARNTVRYAGIQDFRDPLEADPGWVVDGNMDEEIDREKLLEISLPAGIVDRAQHMLADASAMADRGALFAAKQQFLRIIRVTCQSLDAQIGKPIHSRALARGLRALKEADDFAMTGDSPESDVFLKSYIAGHRTPVLKNRDSSSVTALLAMQAYYKYAYEQLTLAGNNESGASGALYSLGRIESLLSEDNGNRVGGGPKALAFYHAALTVNPNNSLAANELGVMLARRGRIQEAHNVLLQATRTGRSVSALQNLARVQQQLGNSMAASQTSQAAANVAAANPQQTVNKRYGGVQWVDHATFNSPNLRQSGVVRSRAANGSNKQVGHAYPSQPAAPPVKAKKKFRWPRSNTSVSKSAFWNF